MATNATGRLLVATPAIADGIFDRTVVFVIQHDESGAMGVIINQPTEHPVSEHFPEWAPLHHDPAVVFVGGPVEANGLLSLAKHVGDRRRDQLDPDIAAAIGSGDLVSVDLSADPAIAAAHVDRLRMFQGYSGWAPGQLDHELRLDAWFVVDAADDLWSHEPATLYDEVLRRQRGEMRWFANLPDDPSLN